MKHLKLFFACLLMAVLSIGQVWANDVSFSKSDFSWTSNQSSGNPVSATKDGITITCTKANIPSGSYMVFNKDGVLAISSTAGNITAIDFTCTADDYTGNMTDVSNISTTNWSTTVSCTGSKTTVRVTSIVVTVSGESPTLSSIAVATAPTTLTYTEGEYFDPTGLVITRTYSSGNPDSYTYANHTSEFSFTPSTSTALTTSDASVTITYGGKSTSLAITVNAAEGGQGGGSETPADHSFDLSKKTYTTGNNLVTWSNSYVTITNSGTNATNYLGGDENNRTSSRFYSDNTLTITPANGYTLSTIEFTATSSSYATTLKNSTWTNASASAADTKVTVTPTNGATAISATVGGTCGFTSIVVKFASSSGGSPEPTV